MITESILKLTIAFANTPMKGLFFWEAILFLNDDEFKKVVEEKFNNLTTSNAGDKSYSNALQKILETMIKLREEIAADPEVKTEVEMIRDSIITNTANDIIMDTIEEALEE